MTTAPIINLSGMGSFAWSNHHSLLDALESAGIDINYSCRAGVCGACRITLLEGKVHWRNESILTLHQHEILACSVIPLTDITISLS
jgi:ferredoxin